MLKIKFVSKSTKTAKIHFLTNTKSNKLTKILIQQKHENNANTPFKNAHYHHLSKYKIAKDSVNCLFPNMMDYQNENIKP